MIKKLQFYISHTVDPYVNLATEKILFDTVDNETVILYLWQNQSTVVIGKNQNAFSECRTELLAKECGTLARRLSGGGAVFHDLGNLNFTFISSADNLDVTTNMEVIRQACLLAGITAELSGRNDILADNRKFSGNAFYNSSGRSYHHGTILIGADMQRLDRYLTPPKAKLESKGIKSVRSRVVNLSELSPSLSCDSMKSYLLSAAKAVFGFTPEAIGEIDKEKLADYTEYFSNRDFVYGSPIPFDVSCEGRLPFGNVTINICVKNGCITNIKLYTDALDHEISAVIERALTSIPFDIKTISETLTASLDEATAEALTDLLFEQIFS